MGKVCMVMDKNFVTIGAIAKWKSISYVRKFCGIGSFEIKMPITKQNKEYAKNGYWFYLDDGILGFVSGLQSKSKNNELIISGKLCEGILEWRVIPKTENYSGTRSQIAYQIFNGNFRPIDDEKRWVSMFITSPAAEDHFLDGGEIRMQRTGSVVADAIEDVLSPEGFGYKVTPVVRTKESISSAASITKLIFATKKGKDRSLGNTEGNKPIVFSQRLQNLEDSTYKMNCQNERNFIYISGEEPAPGYRIQAVIDDGIEGLYRKEGYVDARDLRQEDIQNDIYYTDEEYAEMLISRGNEKRREKFSKTEDFDCTLVRDKQGFEYGKDFFLGDYITVYDEVMGIAAKMQITSVNITRSGFEKCVVTAGYKELNFIQKLKKGGLI